MFQKGKIDKYPGPEIDNFPLPQVMIIDVLFVFNSCKLPVRTFGKSPPLLSVVIANIVYVKASYLNTYKLHVPTRHCFSYFIKVTCNSGKI